jgi:hypothetical protein
MGAAAAPMLIGSAIGGLTNRNNPLQGALLGGALGGAGGAFMSGTGGLSSLLSGTGSTASGILPSAASGSTTINAVTPMAGQAFVNPVATSLTTGPSISANIANEASKFAIPEGFGGVKGMFSGGIGSSIYTQPNLGGGPTTGLIGSSLNESNGFFRDFGDPGERFKLGDLGKFAQQNPYLTQMAMQSAQQMMQQPQAQFAPAGQIQRGGIQDVQIASALPQAPRISLI